MSEAYQSFMKDILKAINSLEEKISESENEFKDVQFALENSWKPLPQTTLKAVDLNLLISKKYMDSTHLEEKEARELVKVFSDDLTKELRDTLSSIQPLIEHNKKISNGVKALLSFHGVSAFITHYSLGFGRKKTTQKITERFWNKQLTENIPKTNITGVIYAVEKHVKNGLDSVSFNKKRNAEISAQNIEFTELREKLLSELASTPITSDEEMENVRDKIDMVRESKTVEDLKRIQRD